MTETPDRLQIRVGEQVVGTLGRGQIRDDSVFSYREDASADNAVSLTMPTRLDSYGWEHGIHPVFEMNLPEGALREELMRRFSKAVRGFDDFALLAIVGPHQLGRLAIASTPATDQPPATSLSDLLVHDGAQGLFEDLLQTYGQYSGVSGVQPKVLVRDSAAAIDRLTHRGRLIWSRPFAPKSIRSWQPMNISVCGRHSTAASKCQHSSSASAANFWWSSVLT